MKKIFIPVLTLLIVCFATQSYGRWGENFSRNNRTGANSLFSSDSDGYWLNKLRGYKKYPINFYSQRLLNKNSGEETTQYEAREYQRGVAVTARLGQRMYDSSTYTITTKTGGEQYRATSDGSLYNAQYEVKIKEGQIFTPIGEIKVNGQYYLLFEVPESAYIIAVDYKGYFLDALGIIDDGNLYVAKDITVVRPHDLQVEPYQKVQSDTSDTEFNFEIRYGGIQGDDMVFIVAEGDDEEGKRKYAPLTEKIVQVNGINFEVIHASPDYIEYVIMDQPQVEQIQAQ